MNRPQRQGRKPPPHMAARPAHKPLSSVVHLTRFSGRPQVFFRSPWRTSRRPSPVLCSSAGRCTPSTFLLASTALAQRGLTPESARHAGKERRAPANLTRTSFCGHAPSCPQAGLFSFLFFLSLSFCCLDKVRFGIDLLGRLLCFR